MSAKKTASKKTVVKKNATKKISQQRPSSKTNFLLLLSFCVLIFILFVSLY